jgi:PhzF family phenazine biosynthesis protein
MKIFTVDTFTNKPFTGNQAGVCILDKEIDDGLMLQIAKELNYSETAFALPLKENINKFNLRWFTPKQEIDLCGHATLATARVLYKNKFINKNLSIEFETRSGVLITNISGEKIIMNFPARQISQSNIDEIIVQFTQVSPLFVGIDEDWCLVELANENAVKSIIPDFELLKSHKQKVFTITAKSDNPEYDFISRCFGPAIGINEDPVTGSAHCYLTPYWSNKMKKNKLIGFQASERTGKIECELIENGRVLLTGESVIMSEIKQNWA